MSEIDESGVQLTTATITIRHIVNAGGGDAVFTEVADDEGNLPPIIEVLGMMELARGAITDAGGIYDQADDDE